MQQFMLRNERDRFRVGVPDESAMQIELLQLNGRLRHVLDDELTEALQFALVLAQRHRLGCCRKFAEFAHRFAGGFCKCGQRFDGQFDFVFCVRTG